MMKKVLSLVITTLLISGIYLVSAFAADEPKGPTTVTNFGKMATVTFKHSTHKKDLKCVTCHHKEDGNNYKCGTAACHQAEQKGKALKIKDAAHKEQVGKCWSCHFQGSPKATKPMKCKDCHSKR